MRSIFKFIIISIVILFLVIFGINFYVVYSTKGNIINNYSNIDDVDCILILGAGIWGDEPSPMLEDRLLEGLKLYKNKISNKIIVSGDHGKSDYDEVNIMKDYLIDKGVPSEDIFMDHAGFSTYDSIYRVKEIFKAENIIVVTQKYHLFRALYIANGLDIKAYGANSDPRRYVGASYRELREVAARNKDFVKMIFKPKSTYLGDEIPVSGDGNITNDRKEN